MRRKRPDHETKQWPAGLQGKPMWINYQGESTPEAAMWDTLSRALYHEYRRLQGKLYGMVPYTATPQEEQMHLDCMKGMGLLALVRDVTYLIEIGTLTEQ